MKTICAECGARAEHDGIVIGEVTHPTEPKLLKTAIEWYAKFAGEVFEEGPHIAYCIAPGECAFCGVPFGGEPVHQKAPLACEPADEACHTFVCSWCGQKIRESHQFDGNQCTECKYVRSVPTAAPAAAPTAAPAKPSSKAWRYHQTVCSLGLRFRDLAPELTREWYMFTPLDLSEDGEQTDPLISANTFVIGQVTVTVTSGTVRVAYKVDLPAVGGDMTFALLPDLNSLDQVDIQKMNTYRFGEEISIQNDLGGDTQVLLYLFGHADYDVQDERIERFSDAADPYQTMIEDMKRIMDERYI